MSDALQDFLIPRLPIAGLAAYRIEESGRVVATQCTSRSLPPSAADKMLSSMIQTGRDLLPTNNESALYCWSFDRLKVYVAARADAACLAVLVESNPDVQIMRIRETLQAFVDLPTQ